MDIHAHIVQEVSEHILLMPMGVYMSTYKQVLIHNTVCFDLNLEKKWCRGIVLLLPDSTPPPWAGDGCGLDSPPPLHLLNNLPRLGEASTCFDCSAANRSKNIFANRVLCILKEKLELASERPMVPS